MHSLAALLPLSQSSSITITRSAAFHTPVSCGVEQKQSVEGCGGRKLGVVRSESVIKVSGFGCEGRGWRVYTNQTQWTGSGSWESRMSREREPGGLLTPFVKGEEDGVCVCVCACAITDEVSGLFTLGE